MAPMAFDPARRPVFAFVAAMAAATVLLTLCGSAIAAPAMRDDASVTLRHIDMTPRDPAQARILLRRIGEAALEACGASPFSLPDYRDAVRASPCWKTAVTRAVNQVNSALLAEAFAAERRNLKG